MECPYLKEHKEMLNCKDGKCPMRKCPEFKKYFEGCKCKCGINCKCENCDCNKNTKCPYLKDQQKNK